MEFEVLMWRGICVKFLVANFPGNWRTKINGNFRQNFAAFFISLLENVFQKFHLNFALGDYGHFFFIRERRPDSLRRINFGKDQTGAAPVSESCSWTEEMHWGNLSAEDASTLKSRTRSSCFVNERYLGAILCMAQGVDLSGFTTMANKCLQLLHRQIVCDPLVLDGPSRQLPIASVNAVNSRKPFHNSTWNECCTNEVQSRASNRSTTHAGSMRTNFCVLEGNMTANEC